jgi:hypothetical protein
VIATPIRTFLFITYPLVEVFGEGRRVPKKLAVPLP